MGASFLILCINACKTQNKVSDNTDNIFLENAQDNTKVDLALVEKYWQLIELYGNPIIAGENIDKMPHIILKMDGNRFNGNTGCNRIVGTYQTKAPDRIKFSETVSTKMMCLNMETETKFLQVLEAADSYIAKNDTLMLNRARMAPLARFVAVYLR